MSEHKHEHEHDHEHDHCACDAHSHTANIEIGCCDGCGHSHKKEHKSMPQWTENFLIILSGITLALGFLPVFSDPVSTCIFIVSAALSGYALIPASLSSVRRLKMDENMLVLIAIVVAFVIGEGAEAAAVSLFFRLGERIEDYAVARSKKAIESLYEIRTDHAVRLNADGSTTEIPAEAVEIGDMLLVAPYEKLPVDGIAVSDSGTADASAITGESMPVEITAGMRLLSGTVNGAEVLKMKADAKFHDSAASRIIEVVENAAEKKGKTDKFITKFAAVYTPAVVCIAVLIALIPSLIYGNPGEYIHRALIFLVASCPCALVLSVPLGFFAGIGGLSKKGVIVKGGRYVEALAKTDSVLFDKTGTLTSGDFELEQIVCADGFTENEVLRLAAYADQYSTHPLAGAIRAAFGEAEIEESRISGFKEIPGNGTEIQLDGKTIRCGSKKYMGANGIDTAGVEGAQAYVAVDGRFAGALTLTGKLRQNAKSAVDALRALGMQNIVMLTGDNEQAAQKTAEKCGITDYKAGLLPEQKTELLNGMKRKGLHPAFVGDGINDTPTLVSADVGIAMGGGTAAAIEVGDVVLMNNNPMNIVSAIRMSRRAMGVIKVNIWFALLVKAAVLILGALGLAPIWAAVFADVGVCIITVLNAARLLKTR